MRASKHKVSACFDGGSFCDGPAKHMPSFKELLDGPELAAPELFARAWQLWGQTARALSADAALHTNELRAALTIFDFLSACQLDPKQLGRVHIAQQSLVALCGLLSEECSVECVECNEPASCVVSETPAPAALQRRCKCASAGWRCNYPPRRGGGGEPHAMSARDSRRSLLGGHKQFCRAFYHANQWEADVFLCLCCSADATGAALVKSAASESCGKLQVTIVARLVMRSGEDRVTRYANCFRGASEQNVHAEEFLLRDEETLAILRSGAAAELLLYMSYQPCHHSGGRVSGDPARQQRVASRRADQGHPISCSERLRDFAARELAPRGVRLTCVLADLYKVMWTPELMVERAPDATTEHSVYTADASAGREGMRLLLASPGVAMRGMGAEDWSFLVSLCDRGVQAAWRAQSAPFTRVHAALRAKLDEHIARFLAGLQRGELGVGSSGL